MMMRAFDPQQLFQRRHFSGPEATDPTTGKSATLHFPAIDLDIDSDANGRLERNLAEDIAETDSERGQYIPIFSGDIDGDLIPDRSDFDRIVGASFTPVKLSLSSNIAFAGTEEISLKFDFDDAGSRDDQTAGLFRLWTKDASESRKTETDLIASGTSFFASDIGLSAGNTVTL